MALIAYNSNIQFASPLILAEFDNVVVGNLGFIYGQGALITATIGHNLVSVSGTVASGGTAIVSTPANPLDGSINIAVNAGGQISANFGVEFSGASLSVSNAGAILAVFHALALDGGTLGTTHSISNSGIISGSFAITGQTTLQAGIHLTNTGEIVGASGWAIYLEDASVAADVISNAGLIRGDVLLGGGRDTYDGRPGGSVQGLIAGGAGDDRFRPGAGEEGFVGGNGLDTLDFRGGGGAVIIALDNVFDAGGWAEGDTWTGIENVIGTRGNDRIGGDSSANRLTGAAGADVLSGGAGIDTLEGGEGIDTLTGGGGNDAYVFRRLGEIGDVITDFSASAAGNDDRFWVALAGFAGGMATGTLAASRFRTRADNLAQDGDDRFIFRNTDHTLWFDADGNGAGAAVMLADLQPGATMTASDIVIF